MSIYKKILIAVFIGCLSIAIISCEKEGPAEKAGEKIDQTVEKTGNKVEKAGEAVKEKTEEAKEEVKKKTE
jgi:hypothetical protein